MTRLRRNGRTFPLLMGVLAAILFAPLPVRAELGDESVAVAQWLHLPLEAAARSITEQTRSVPLSLFRGKVIVVDWWLSGCPGCYASFARLSNLLAEPGAEESLAVVAITPETAPVTELARRADRMARSMTGQEPARLFQGMYVLKGDSRMKGSPLVAGVTGFPHAIVIGRDGRLFVADSGQSQDDGGPYAVSSIVKLAVRGDEAGVEAALEERSRIMPLIERADALQDQLQIDRDFFDQHNRDAAVGAEQSRRIDEILGLCGRVMAANPDAFCAELSAQALTASLFWARDEADKARLIKRLDDYFRATYLPYLARRGDFTPVTDTWTRAMLDKARAERGCDLGGLLGYIDAFARANQPGR